MDLYAKDHPVEAAALRRQIAKRKLPSFKFEKLPPTVRHRIYRELLLKPKEDDTQSTESYLSEHEELGWRIADVMVDLLDDNHKMHPEIMRTNKNIHEEAAAVLYGENWFTGHLNGMGHQTLWQGWLGETTKCPRRYSRLITKMCLNVNTRGDENDPSQADALYWTTKNLKHACKVLTLNNFKILKVDFYNGLSRKYSGSARRGYYGESCLESLKTCRAEKFLINTYASPRYAAQLKAVIEGPKNAEFLAYRKATENEDEPGSDFYESKNSDL